MNVEIGTVAAHFLYWEYLFLLFLVLFLCSSAVDPDPNPDPPDPHVFGPPGSGSGSISERYGSESGSFYNQEKKVRKTLIPTAL
jgi:hypothetical protein